MGYDSETTLKTSCYVNIARHKDTSWRFPYAMTRTGKSVEMETRFVVPGSGELAVGSDCWRDSVSIQGWWWGGRVDVLD